MSMTFYQAIVKFHRRLIITKRPATVAYYQFYFQLLKLYVGDVPVETLTEDYSLDLILTLKKNHPKMKPITINKTLSAFKTILKYGANFHLLIHRLKEAKPLIPIISESSVVKIISHLKQIKHRAIGLRNLLIITILYETGIRMHELIHLKKKDVDLIHYLIRVELTKTHTHRIVCFLKATAILLQEWFELYPNQPYVFFDLKRYQPMTTSAIESMFYQLKNRCLIKDNITPHKWRHTFATIFLRRGGDLETLRMLLGHSNLKTTQKYLHLTEQDIQKKYQEIMKMN
jgi:integrase/recombinase XerD